MADMIAEPSDMLEWEHREIDQGADEFVRSGDEASLRGAKINPFHAAP